MGGWIVFAASIYMSLSTLAEPAAASPLEQLREEFRKNATTRLGQIKRQSGSDKFFSNADEMCAGLERLVPEDAHDSHLHAVVTHLKRYTQDGATHLQLCAELAMLRRQPARSFLFARIVRTADPGAETVWAAMWIATAHYLGEGVAKSRTSAARYLDRELATLKSAQDKRALLKLRKLVER